MLAAVHHVCKATRRKGLSQEGNKDSREQFGVRSGRCYRPSVASMVPFQQKGD